MPRARATKAAPGNYRRRNREVQRIFGNSIAIGRPGVIQRALGGLRLLNKAVAVTISRQNQRQNPMN